MEKKRFHPMRKRFYKLLGGKCQICGYTDLRALVASPTSLRIPTIEEKRLVYGPIVWSDNKIKALPRWDKYWQIRIDDIKTGQATYKLICKNCQMEEIFEFL